MVGNALDASLCLRQPVSKTRLSLPIYATKTTKPLPPKINRGNLADAPNTPARIFSFFSRSLRPSAFLFPEPSPRARRAPFSRRSLRYTSRSPPRRDSRNYMDGESHSSWWGLITGKSGTVLDAGQQKPSLELKTRTCRRKFLQMILPFITLVFLSILGLSCVFVSFVGSER